MSTLLRKSTSILVITIMFLGWGTALIAKTVGKTGIEGSIYQDGWNDLNKNGKMDTYENPKLDIEKRKGDGANQKKITKSKAKIAKKLKEQRKGRTPALGMKHTDESKKISSEVSNKYWDTQDTFARNPEKVEAILQLSHKEAKLQFGISTTHYYRLKKRFASNDSK